MSEADFSNSLWPDSMNAFDLTLSSPAENLALDEALLDAVETNPRAAWLRFWVPDSYFVVLGRSNQAETEVNLAACRDRSIPVLRRASGGGAVLVGPGCLCYSLVLPLNDLHRQLGISHVTKELMSRMAAALDPVLPNVDVCGTSDLVRNGWKFSGNAQRWLKRAFIHHGTILFDFNLSLIQDCLSHPTREPAYRRARRHSEFVKNVDQSPDELQRCIRSIWNAVPAESPTSILSTAAKIAASRYTSNEWLISFEP